MISNFPESIQTDLINSFSFGDAEARDDQLLRDCHISTLAINEITQDNKDIILGHRGTGKSAIVRLLEEGIFSFKPKENHTSIIVVIDEEFDYHSIRSHLAQNRLKNQKEELICRAVWEILIIFKTLKTIEEKTSISDNTLKTFSNEIESLLGISEKKVSIFSILLSHKKKIGIKFDTIHPNIVDTYVGLEPSADSTNNDEATILKIGEYRKYINKILSDNKIAAHILFDRLDDFVIHEDYITQKLLLQELLATQRAYREKCSNIKIKTFFRTDLFERLDLSKFGADKIYARCIYLNWKSADIKRFIARRIAHNLLSALPLQCLELQIDQDRFFIHREQLSLLKASKSISKFSIFNKDHWKKLIFLIKVQIRKNNKKYGRITDSNDVIHEEIITSIFPRHVDHQKLSGETQSIDVFDFFDSHLQFSNNETTPRSVLLFLDCCLVEQKKYYQQNTDIKTISKNQESEFPLFLGKSFFAAYKEFCTLSWKIQYQWAQEWGTLVSCIEKFAHIGNFIFVDFQKTSKIDEQAARQFLAFATHTGLIRCINDRDPIEKRKYEIPVMFRKCHTAQST